jgi:hypothetical protein
MNSCASLSSTLSILLTFVAGFLTAIFAEPLRLWIYRPVLNLQFDNNDHCVAKTDEGSPPTHRAHYIRVKATNRSSRLAKGCRAYLVAIDRRGPTGSWNSTDYCEALPLAWSARPDVEHGVLDLPKDIPHFVDVLSTREVAPSFRPEIVFTPYRIQHLFSSPGTYRFTILVTGDALKPAKLSISFKWTGVWDQYEVGAV